MSQYKEFAVDFVKCTITNNLFLKNSNIKLPKEVTHLLNYCYGLPILPQQNITNVLKTMPNDLKHYGIERTNFESTKSQTFEQFIKSMRNALSHTHIKTFAENAEGDIKEIEFKDYESKQDVANDTYHTRINFTLEEFENFISIFSNEYLKAN